MLVLTRKLNESIKIGDDVEVKIIGIEGDQVKLGISAPRNIDIHRKEIYLAIQEENNAAASSSLDVLKQLTNATDKNND
ncbi:carbon storage regulator CsrA [Evansella clarkii]|jgi:carbon storage regulator|uniref:carbon storage regulator CsrA n=1 Tax=Evansella clarkii TaxID=79879 RepID=UPI0009983E61|nr:carbon storage regulator CsrA [Evansella clarkii]